ncbi:DMT family transporter [Epibacterium ulvae]|uniref:DMT family transporter n=1 Tax=Epibacterium ulvae TaxID=1156985 RepID=UPI001BFC3150|nr:DMT family transporter [Epibacterium ulvae]MBT8153347.1 DMT family transporter [Epibacterium ulvae]
MALQHWLIIILLGIGWGMSFMFNAILLQEVGPFVVAAGRVAFGALGCWAYLLLRGVKGQLPYRTALALMAFGGLAYSAPFTFYALGQQHIASGVAGIINATTPALAVVVAHFWPGGERATWLKSVGVLCGLSGIAVLSLPLLRSGEGSAVWAVMITLCAPVCYAFSVNVARQFRAIEPVVLVSWALTGATLCQIPVTLLFDEVPTGLSLQALAAFAAIGFVLTSAAFIIFYWVLPKVGPTNITLPTMIAPASALFFGAWALGEQLTRAHGVGLAVILVGLLLIDGRLFKSLAARA